jgi:hypothetical protein
VASNISRSKRAEIARRARYCCEYCLIHEEDSGFPHEVDHIISRKHGGSSGMENFAFSCLACNRNKGTDVASVRPMTGEAVRLFDPRQNRWADHFKLNGATIEPLSETAAATIRILRLNAPERISERRILQALGRYPRP